jgi:hypothetical protein
LSPACRSAAFIGDAPNAKVMPFYRRELANVPGKRNKGRALILGSVSKTRLKKSMAMVKKQSTGNNESIRYDIGS